MVSCPQLVLKTLQDARPLTEPLAGLLCVVASLSPDTLPLEQFDCGHFLTSLNFRTFWTWCNWLTQDCVARLHSHQLSCRARRVHAGLTWLINSLHFYWWSCCSIVHQHRSITGWVFWRSVIGCLWPLRVWASCMSLKWWNTSLWIELRFTSLQLRNVCGLRDAVGVSSPSETVSSLVACFVFDPMFCLFLQGPLKKGMSRVDKQMRRIADIRRLTKPGHAVKISVEGNRMPLWF